MISFYVSSADIRAQVERLRYEANEFRFNNGYAMPVHVLGNTVLIFVLFFFFFFCFIITVIISTNSLIMITMIINSPVHLILLSFTPPSFVSSSTLSLPNIPFRNTVYIFRSQSDCGPVSSEYAGGVLQSSRLRHASDRSGRGERSAGI